MTIDGRPITDEEFSKVIKKNVQLFHKNGWKHYT